MLQRARQVLFALLALAAAGTAPTLAAGTGYGTPAWSTQALTLFEGPGGVYDNVGTIAADERVTVYRCTVLWCMVDDGHARGWASLASLSFGQTSADRFSGPRLNYGSGGPGQVCFYEGRNYTGAAVCAGPGQVFSDLLLSHIDDRFSSVSVEGNVSAAVCRDRDFQSYCQRVIVSQPVLNRHLDNAVSSIRVY